MIIVLQVQYVDVIPQALVEIMLLLLCVTRLCLCFVFVYACLAHPAGLAKPQQLVDVSLQL